MGFLRLLLSILLFVSISAQAVAAGEALSFAVTDLQGYDEAKREFGPFVEALSRHLDRRINIHPVPSRTAAVTALKARKLDLVLTGPAEYVVLRKLTRTRPLVAFSRPDYYSGIMVMADSGIYKVSDLRGKKVVFGTVGSTSHHLGPMQVLSDNGLDPLRDITSIHIKRQNKKSTWEELKTGKIDAIGMSYRNLMKLRAQEKELEPGAFRVIARGPDLPNDVLMVAEDLDPKLAKRLLQIFKEHPRELINAILQGEDNQKYRGMKFLTEVNDSDYDYVRSMYRTIGFPAYSEFIGD